MSALIWVLSLAQLIGLSTEVLASQGWDSRRICVGENHPRCILVYKKDQSWTAATLNRERVTTERPLSSREFNELDGYVRSISGPRSDKGEFCPWALTVEDYNGPKLLDRGVRCLLQSEAQGAWNRLERWSKPTAK